MKKISLNGDYKMKYLGARPYISKKVPNLDDGFLIKESVPAYWEDMMDKFRENTIHTELNYNPSYTLQRYPQAGYVPDMCLPNVLGCFAYEKKVKIDNNELGNLVKLRFGGVQNRVSVWINGNFIGEHEGYSSEFYFDVKPEVIKEGNNTFVFAVSNTYLKGYKKRPVVGCTNRAANQATGGIYGDVELCFSYDGLEDVYVITDEKCENFTVNVCGAEEFEKQVIISDTENEIICEKIPKGCCSVTLSAIKLKKWSTITANLYTVTVKTEKDVVSSIFGVRRVNVSADKKTLLLNDKRFYFRAICEHGYYPLTVHPNRDKEYYKKVVSTIKELGFNAIRFHTWIPMEEYMQAADELGILLEVETPNNTSLKEWKEIIKYVRKHPSVVMFSSGNEMLIDEAYISHLRKCAKLVHSMSDCLFSPMSAMRGVEYGCEERGLVEKPFRYNPKRLEKLSKFCDVYNSYSRGLTSYFSDKCNPETLNERHAVYKKPLFSHEICILGTYCDLSLADRYKGSRIGDTELYSSVRKHLSEKGLLNRAELFYKNSAEWQKLLRKQCFEDVRRTSSLAGYDFLGDIDHHWHTFGYCVGLMNEFYELKPGETVQNVLRYNSDLVLLAELPENYNLIELETVSIPIYASNYLRDIEDSQLEIEVLFDDEVYKKENVNISKITADGLKELYTLSLSIPSLNKPVTVKILATLKFEDVNVDNVWDLYAFPKTIRKVNAINNDVVIFDGVDENELCDLLKAGKSVLTFSAKPFQSVRTSFRISSAGRTEGHLATVIENHPIFKNFPNNGFCGWQFKNMLNGGRSIVLDLPKAEDAPIVEIAASYKYARREAVILECKVDKGKLFVCTLNLPENDCGAQYLKDAIYNYVQSDEFNPKCCLTIEDINKLCNLQPVFVIENTNEACNVNDVTM